MEFLSDVERYPGCERPPISDANRGLVFAGLTCPFRVPAVYPWLSGFMGLVVFPHSQNQQLASLQRHHRFDSRSMIENEELTLRRRGGEFHVPGVYLS